MIGRVQVIDSHTGGEPTRVVVAGGPDLGGGSVADRLEVFRRDHDAFRSAVIHEPRGSDVLVGALLLEPADPACAAGVIFFNNVGFLGMCGHGTIGLVVTLGHLGRIRPGPLRIETPVGVVTAVWDGENSVRIENVPSHREAAGVTVGVPGRGTFSGDVAWGGNWFFLVPVNEPLTVANAEALTALARDIRAAVNAQGYPAVDHVELFGPPLAGGHARNFVLCPGHAYDRSPCGTGTSAKLACLAAGGHLAEGESWMQEGILGTSFAGRFRWIDRGRGTIAPEITGSAFVTAEATLILDPRDPFRFGIRS